MPAFGHRIIFYKNKAGRPTWGGPHRTLVRAASNPERCRQEQDVQRHVTDRRRDRRAGIEHRAVQETQAMEELPRPHDGAGRRRLGEVVVAAVGQIKAHDSCFAPERFCPECRHNDVSRCRIHLDRRRHLYHVVVARRTASARDQRHEKQDQDTQCDQETPAHRTPFSSQSGLSGLEDKFTIH